MDKIDWQAIRDLATELNRPIKTLKVIEHDPFYIGETQIAEAKWFAEIYREYGIDRGFHLRRIHYRLATQPLPVLDWDGEPYRNDRRSWVGLLRASLYARYLGLIPVGTLADHRNPDAVICLEEMPAEASVETGDPCFGGFSDLSIYNKRREPSLYREPELPSLSLAESGSLPELGLLGSLMDELALPELGSLEAADPIQPYHVELWCEKTTCADILDDLARAHRLNVVYGAGDLSETACQNLMQRVAANGGRPVRVLYINDFDPRGHGMALAVARKLEFMIARDSPSTDLQVRQIVLTKEQVERLNLPRNEIKESDHGKTSFEAHHGAGATELDALEAVRPGELRRIVETEIARYEVDSGTLDEQWQEIVDETNAELEEATQEVHANYEEEIAPIVADLGDIEQLADTLHEEAAAIVDPIIEEIATLGGVRAALLAEADAAIAPILARYQTEVVDAARTLREQAETAIEPLAERFHDEVIEAASALRNRAEPVFDAIKEELEERGEEILANMGEIEPNGDEDEDPLFDSRRKFIEQTDRYKRHQGKPTERRARVVRRVTLKCSHCKKPFQTANSQKKFCSQKCQARAAQ